MAGTFNTRERTGAHRGPMHSPDRTSPTLSGRVLRPGDPGYDARRAGFNIVVEHRPAAIVEAHGPADVVAAVRLATGDGRPVAVMATGHGPSVPADGAVLVRTDRLDGVAIDPVRRTARVGAGARWRSVVAAASRHGLAPLNGSSPAVGVAGYTLGGGIGLLGRSYGFAADHVRRIDIVTADGRLRRVTADSDDDLFWALRGAGSNFGVATELEIDLFPVTELLGGELCFGPEASADVLDAYADWAAAAPETMASSLLLLAYPDVPEVPPELRGRHVTHVRIADSAPDHRDGLARVAALRAVAPRLVDTVRVMPYGQVGTIHHEPVDVPVPAFDRNILLDRFDAPAASVVSAHAGPEAGGGFLVELRAWGGALARPASPPNAVGGRDAAFSLLAISDPDPDTRTRRDGLLAAMAPWASGGTYLNFAGVEDTAPADVRRGYRPEDWHRLRRLKATYDPDATFRVNFTIPPAERSTR